MKLIAAAATFALMLILQVLHRIGKTGFVQYSTIPCLFLNVVCAVCTYKEWIPQTFTDNYKKDVMSFHTLMYFILVNSVPLCDLKSTAFIMLPILFIGTYMQLSVEREMWNELFLRQKMYSVVDFRTPDAMFWDRGNQAVVIGVIFLIANYLQQLDISRLTIQKHIIRK